MKHITREEAMKLLGLPGFYRKKCEKFYKDLKLPKYTIATYSEFYKYGDAVKSMTMAVCSKNVSELYEL